MADKIFMSDPQDPADFTPDENTEDVAFVPEGTLLNYDKWLLLVAEAHQKKGRPLTEKESITCALISLL